MNPRSILGNMSVAFIAQGFGMLLGVLQSLLVPKLLTVENYSYWQLFIFYAGYAGFFTLGLSDGVYLIFGGQSRKSIDKKAINSQFAVEVAIQLFFAGVIFALAIGGAFGAERSFVLTCLSLQLVLQNASTFIMYVLQAMNETKLSSYNAIIARVAYLLPLGLMLVLRVESYRPYIMAYVASSAISVAYGLSRLAGFRTAGLHPVRKALIQSAASIRVGIKLMCANLASQLIIGVARFVIDAVWGIQTFGQLSLSLSMVTFFMAFMAQASMVLFPALRQSEEGEIKKFYHMARDFMGLAFPALYLLYVPLVGALSLWLPQYASSFSYFAYLIPICVFDSKMDITCTTLFKVLREERQLLRINCVAALACACGTLFGAYCMHSLNIIICALVVTIIARSIYSEMLITAKLGLQKSAIPVGEVIITALFIAFNALLSPALATASFAVVYLVFLGANRSRLSELLGTLKGIAKK